MESMEICEDAGPMNVQSAFHAQEFDENIWSDSSTGSSVEFQTEISLANFINDCKRRPNVDPFNGSSVVLFPSKPRYWDLVKNNLFQQFGKFVTVLKIDNSKWDMTKPLEFCKELNHCLKFLPNLLSLEIVQDDEFEGTGKEEVKKYLRDNPLPALPRLESLDIPEECGELIRNHYIQGYGNQLLKLTTDCQEWIPNFKVCNRLTELHVKNVDCFKSLTEKLLAPMKAANKNLNKLGVELNNCVDAKQLFKVLQPFGIRALKLSFCPPSGGCKDCDECDICGETCGIAPFKINEILDPHKPGPGILASLEAFRLDCDSLFTTFNFLRFMPALKYLVVNSQLPMMEKNDPVGLEIRKCVNKETDSKLWELLQSLKVLKFNDLKFERPATERSGNAFVDLFDQVFPHIFGDLMRPEYEKLRVVCKVWKTVIDNLVQNHPIYRPFTLESFNSIHLVRNFDCHMSQNMPIFAFQMPTAISHAIRNLKDLPGNPFIGRVIAFQPRDNDAGGPVSASDFWNAGTELLEKFGQHIWHFKLSFQNTNKSISELFFYKNLHRCLSLMPNLKSFAFEGDVKVSLAKGKEVKQLEGYIERNSLPKLSHLESLILLSCNTPPMILDALFKAYGGQIERLEVIMIKWKPQHGHLPNLKQLSAAKMCGQTLPLLLLNVKAPLLQKLELALSAPFDEDFLFRMIKSFESVVALSILLLPRPETQGLFMGLRLSSGPTGHQLIPLREGVERQMLPNVMYLNIRACDRKQSFQFLKSFPSLKYLSVRMSDESKIQENEDDIGGELWKCKKLGNQARQSKIWEKLPHLETLHLLPGTKLDKCGYIYVDKRWAYRGMPGALL